MTEHRDVAGLDIEDLISQVKDAVRLAEILDPGDGPGIEVSMVHLTLNAYALTGGGAEIKFKIPFINQDFGYASGGSEEETHTIELAFEPVRSVGTVKGLQQRVKTQLVESVTAIRRSLKAAAGGEVPFEMKTASVTLDFVLDAKGQISLVVRGGVEKNWSNRVKLSLVPRAV